MTKYIIVVAITISIYTVGFGANYTLEIVAPKPGLGTESRYYKTYTGLEYKVPIGVIGGAYPFTYSLTTAPSGMTIDSSTGVITWSNPVEAGSPHSVEVTVSDAESNSTDTVGWGWTITVDTTNTIFLDASVGDGGTGSAVDPFNEIIDVYTGTDTVARDDTTYAGYHIYFRAGTYPLQGHTTQDGTQQRNVVWRAEKKPIIFLAYPGDATPVIDHDDDQFLSGHYFLMSDSPTDDAFFHRIKFQDSLNHTMRVVGDRINWYDCEFYNLGPGAGGANSSFIMTVNNAKNDFNVVSFCDFDVGSSTAFVKFYQLNKSVVHDSSFTNCTDDNCEGIAVKANNTYVDIRNNRIDGIEKKSINGNWNNDENIEYRYNRILNAWNDFGTDTLGGFVINHDGTTLEPVYIYRNTIEGTVGLRFGDTGDGPFYVYDNVIVNLNSGTPELSHISHHADVNDASVVIITSSNVAEYPTASAIDANGNLQGAFTQWIGLKGYQLGSSGGISMPSNANINIGAGIKVD